MIPRAHRTILLLPFCALFWMPFAIVAQEEAVELARSRPAHARVENTGRVAMDLPGANEQVRAFCEQGMIWLHGGDLRQADRWFFEAASLEPRCVMAWCGLALANEHDELIASRYAKRARELATGAESRERLWADAVDGYFDTAAAEHDRRVFFIQALDRLVTAYPEDAEARALLARQMIEGRDSIGMHALTAPAAALLDGLLREQPEHPAHRYRVRLWLAEHPQRALESAEMIRRRMKAVPQALSDAGRVFAALGRAADAVSCFEAAESAAMDQMKQEPLLLPQEVSGRIDHLRLLITHLGRANRVPEAVAITRRLIALAEPAMPAATPPQGSGHAMSAPKRAENLATIGQRAFLELVVEHQLWPELHQADAGGWLESAELEIQARNCHARALAAAALGDATALRSLRDEMRAFSQRTPANRPISECAAYRDLATKWSEEVQTAAVAPQAEKVAKNSPQPANTAQSAAWLPVAPPLSLPDGVGLPQSLAELRGGPVVLVFYLGAGCPHCIQQLRTFAPLAEAYRAAGITILAVSTDSVAGLKETLATTDAGKAAPFRLLSDEPLKAFRDFGAFDERRGKPLHGIFLIDGEGRVRWRKIGREPFMQTAELLAAARRVLKLK